MAEIMYKVGDLRRIVRESANEFKPKLGKNVETDDKKNAQETYKNLEKKIKDYYGDIEAPKKKPLQPREDGNKTMLGLRYDAEPSKPFKERVEAQAEGYTSKLEKDNKIEKVGEFSNKFFKNEKETVEKMNDDLELQKKSGLAARVKDQEKPGIYKSHTAVNEQSLKRLTYKHTKFINETQLFNKIPEEYKFDGSRFIVKDAAANEFLVEWVANEKANISEGRILKKRNLKEASKQFDRMAELVNYNPNQYLKKNKVNENKNIDDMFSAIRKIKD